MASGEVDPNIKAGQIQLEIDQDGKDAPIATQVVDQGKTTIIAGLSYTFERTRQFTGLIVTRDPGAPLVWVGSTLLVLGLYMVFFLPAPSRVGAGPQDIRRQRGPLRVHHEA